MIHFNYEQTKDRIESILLRATAGSLMDVKNDLIEFVFQIQKDQMEVAENSVPKSEIRELIAEMKAEFRLRDEQFRASEKETREWYRNFQLQIDQRFEYHQKQMDSRFDAHQLWLDQRFESQQKQMDLRFDAYHLWLDQRFEANQKQMDQRFESHQNQMDLRFEANQLQMNQRFDAFQNQIDQRFDATIRIFQSRFDSLQWVFGTILSLLTLVTAYGTFFKP